jgi:Lar family restriction alleviation protein
MTSTPTQGLLPCPFCGGEAERVTLDDEDNFGGDVITCTRCQASSHVEFGRKENLVDRWNHRTADALLKKVEDEARRYAGLYDQGSDGRNTFTIFAEWASSLAALPASSGGEDRSFAASIEAIDLSTVALECADRTYREYQDRDDVWAIERAVMAYLNFHGVLSALSKRTEGERSDLKDPLKLRAAICKAVWPIARKYSIPMVADDIADAVRDAVLPLLSNPTEQSSSPADVGEDAMNSPLHFNTLSKGDTGGGER